MNFKRILKHSMTSHWQVSRRFPKSGMERIAAAIGDSEHLHMGELRFAVEAHLPWPDLMAGTSSRSRALAVFSNLRVWDTEHNCGVLIYLLLADRKVEIVADRGIHAKVGDEVWVSICRLMEQHFRAGNFEEGALAGIATITDLLKQHFPMTGPRPNELPDYPVTL
jgi:uncharacterized membrane protein